MKILLSRTDSIGDVVLSLPTAGWIKQHLPQAELHFLGRDYTLPVLERCAHLAGRHSLDKWQDQLADQLRKHSFDAIVHLFPNAAVAKAAKQAGVPQRIGTSHRLVHLTTVNRLVNFSRKNSPLHETVLNSHLLKPLGLAPIPTVAEAATLMGWTPSAETLDFLNLPTGKRLLLHPKSKGSAAEWPMQHYAELTQLAADAGWTVVLGGTAEEGERMAKELPAFTESPSVVNMAGRLTLHQYIALIGHCEALVACSTGPLHIAAAAGKRAVGLYPPTRPMHAGRWGPVGPQATALTSSVEVPKDPALRGGVKLFDITPGQVMDAVVA